MKYRTIYADPPWAERGGGKIQRGADRHYPLMSTREILDMAGFVQGLAEDNAHLYLWVTNNFLPEGLEVMRAWGFEYKTMITWMKAEYVGQYALFNDVETTWTADQVGLGQYFRGVTESCLFGVRGSLLYRTTPEGKRAQGRTGFLAPRTVHSRKPQEMRRMIETVSPGPYIELFARRPASGWDVWGNEV